MGCIACEGGIFEREIIVEQKTENQENKQEMRSKEKDEGNIEKQSKDCPESYI